MGKDIKIVDTTLRDGEQKAGVALGLKEKINIAKILDSMGIYQIEAGIPIMGGEEKESIKTLASLGLASKISTWNRLNIDDIKESMECGNVTIHISVPSSDIQIKSKLKKDKQWVIEHLKKCVNFCREKGFEVTIGLEDASRADIDFLMALISIANMQGVERVRYADTVGVLYGKKAFEQISYIKSKIDVEIEIHAHNDLGMAVGNSILAAAAGARYINCTIGGIGERAGNCDFIKFIAAAKVCLNKTIHADISSIEKKQNQIMRIMNLK